jgi:Zn-dependent protease/predicted transcriptional regulator
MICFPAGQEIWPHITGGKKMFGKGLSLFKLFGFEVRIDISWLVIALLVTLTLSRGVFPSMYENLSAGTYWSMGIIGAIGLFASIIFHEFFHSIVARRYGLPMKGITLFIFGGVAEMDDQPQNPKTEFLMAVAGPLSSIFLGFVFYLVHTALEANNFPLPVIGVISYLSFINLILAGFNLVPAFPLDGGRILRSALWQWKGNIRWATRIASSIGSAFGLFLIFMGVLGIFQGNVIGGVWFFMIGMFIRAASSMSYQQVLLQKVLEGETVLRFMKENPVSVATSTSVEELVEDYFYKYHFKMFPVKSDGELAGCITMDDVKEIPKDQRSHKTVGQLLHSCSPDNTISASADALKALTLMNKTGKDKLLVVQEKRLEGIVTRNDILSFFGTKMSLGDLEK